MKICPKCKKEMIKKSYYDDYDNFTEQAYRVYYYYYSCDNCLYDILPASMFDSKEAIKAKELKWNELIIKQLKSFDEIEDKFINRNEVLNLIKNYNGEKIHKYNKTELIYNLDLKCLHFVLFNHKYYLKKSVEKYLYCGNGLFSLRGDFLN